MCRFRRETRPCAVQAMANGTVDHPDDTRTMLGPWLSEDISMMARPSRWGPRTPCRIGSIHGMLDHRSIAPCLNPTGWGRVIGMGGQAAPWGSTELFEPKANARQAQGSRRQGSVRGGVGGMIFSVGSPIRPDPRIIASTGHGGVVIRLTLSAAAGRPMS